ncbi:hypothetical protein D5086_016974 [Populus alba]|uniref:Uncharacterized protein n=1 Tax=Populus alba TaxID=43335 RepID=A0ACC4BVN2_POPAL
MDRWTLEPMEVALFTCPALSNVTDVSGQGSIPQCEPLDVSCGFCYGEYCGVRQKLTARIVAVSLKIESWWDTDGVWRNGNGKTPLNMGRFLFAFSIN